MALLNYYFRFMAYKLPKIKHEDKLLQEGVAYAYLTPTNYTEWAFSRNSINDSKSILGNTLKPFYSIYLKNETTYIFYNDQPPNRDTDSSKGHTKGVILADFESGFWLIHSVPHFPPLTPDYEFPKTGTLKGQSFLCISLDLKNLNKVGVQLQYNQPEFYASFVPQSLKNKLSEVMNAISGVTVTKPPWYNRIVLNSIRNVQFTSFAKSRQFGKDLYEDWVAPSLNSDLLVESWLNGAGRLPSDCSKVFKWVFLLY